MHPHPIRPWIFDITAALLMIVFCVASFAGIGHAADYLQSIGWLAGGM